SRRRDCDINTASTRATVVLAANPSRAPSRVLNPSSANSQGSWQRRTNTADGAGTMYGCTSLIAIQASHATNATVTPPSAGRPAVAIAHSQGPTPDSQSTKPNGFGACP